MGKMGEIEKTHGSPKFGYLGGLHMMPPLEASSCGRGLGGCEPLWTRVCKWAQLPTPVPARAEPSRTGPFELCIFASAPYHTHTGLRPAAHRIKPYLGFGVPIGSAYLSARRTFGRPKVRFNPSPPLVLAEKMAGGTAVLLAGRSAGRRYGRTFGWPIGRPKVRPYLRLAESAGRRYCLIRQPPL